LKAAGIRQKGSSGRSTIAGWRVMLIKDIVPFAVKQ
jgi:hypothetical protein